MGKDTEVCQDRVAHVRVPGDSHYIGAGVKDDGI